MTDRQPPDLPPVGLYSIGIRPISVAALLEVAAAHAVAFVHLRGGSRGYHLADQPHDQLRSWAQHAAHTVPVTAVTTDVDLADLIDDDTRPSAIAELDRLALAAAVLASRGPTALRVLARAPLPLRKLQPGLVPQTSVPVMIELHHPSWLTEPALSSILALIETTPQVGLLADSGQIHHAHTIHQPLHPATVQRVVEHAGLVHLADDGTGLDAAGHCLLASAVHAAARQGWSGQVAFEWTGPDRRPRTCLGRYAAAMSWWREQGQSR